MVFFIGDRVYPNVSYSHLAPWNGFEDEYCWQVCQIEDYSETFHFISHISVFFFSPAFLQPSEPLFAEIGSRFMQEVLSYFNLKKKQREEECSS